MVSMSSYEEFYDSMVAEPEGTATEIIPVYLHLCMSLWNQNREWKHFIFKESLFNIVGEIFNLSTVSCKCDCVSNKENHIHAIGFLKKSVSTTKRFFDKYRKDNGINTKKGSQETWKSLKLESFQHFITAFFYITRQQMRRCEDGSYKVKHTHILPFGLNNLSRFVKLKTFPKSFWDFVWTTLSTQGYGKLVEEAKETYIKYKDKKRQEELLKKVNGRKRIAQCAGLTDERAVELKRCRPSEQYKPKQLVWSGAMPPTGRKKDLDDEYKYFHAELMLNIAKDPFSIPPILIEKYEQIVRVCLVEGNYTTM